MSWALHAGGETRDPEDRWNLAKNAFIVAPSLHNNQNNVSWQLRLLLSWTRAGQGRIRNRGRVKTPVQWNNVQWCDCARSVAVYF